MKIDLVVPVFNEEDTIKLFYKAVREDKILANFIVEIIFINDGSVDDTAFLIDELAANDSRVTGIHLFRNFGKEAALLAGLTHTNGNAVIPLDADLQDPIVVVGKLINKWLETGCDAVLAKRVDRAQDSFIKRETAKYFYRLHNRISTTKIEENVGDFRLLSRELLDKILTLPERNLFMKGLLSWCGGHIEIIEYSRPHRAAGQTKFNATKLWNLALEGITSFSTVPLKIWTYIGFIIAFLSFLFGGALIVQKIIWGNPVAGYPSLMICILFLGGIQLMGIGILGEYIARVYLETKRRPRYLIRRTNKQSHS